MWSFILLACICEHCLHALACLLCCRGTHHARYPPCQGTHTVKVPALSRYPVKGTHPVAAHNQLFDTQHDVVIVTCCACCVQRPPQQHSHLQPTSQHSEASEPSHQQHHQPNITVPAMQCLSAGCPSSCCRGWVPIPTPCSQSQPHPHIGIESSLRLPDESGHQCVRECVGGHLLSAGTLCWSGESSAAETQTSGVASTCAWLHCCCGVSVSGCCMSWV